MNIVVCVKQVPESRDVEMDPETGNLKREGAAAVMNPFDLFALEAGLQLKERYGGTVTAITMGPPQAEEVIREAYMMGADDGMILCDREFAGADTLATSFTLAQGIRHLQAVDLIICGLQTTDGDTAQVGPGIAEFLDIPHETSIQKIHGMDEDGLRVEKDMGHVVMDLSLQLPTLISVAKGVNQPRLLSFRRKLQTRDWPARYLERSDLDDHKEAFFGLDGSPTQVEAMFPPQPHTASERWQGSSQELADRLVQLLVEEKFVQSGVDE